MIVAARIIVFLVLALAGVAKLLDRSGADGVEAFGVPRRLAGPVAVMLPLAELAVAVTILIDGVARFAAIAAAALFLLFVAGVGASLMRGDAPECRCFGALHVRKVDRWTLVRNVGLLAVAGVIVVSGRAGMRSSPTAWIAHLSATQAAMLGGGLALALAIAAVAAFAAALLRQNGRLLLRVEELERRAGVQTAAARDTATADGAALPAGTPAPAFTVYGRDGVVAGLHDLLVPGRILMLVFTDPRCSSCAAVVADVRDWQQRFATKLRIAVIVKTEDRNLVPAEYDGIEHAYAQRLGEVAALYRAHATPMAVAIDDRGVIASALAGGADAIRSLVEEAASGRIGGSALPVVRHVPHRAAASPAAPSGPGIGDPVPEFALHDLDGDTLTSAELRGEPTLLVFWNPRCGFCRRMLEDVRAFEGDPSAARLVLVSTGDAEANREMALASRVLIDEGFRVAGQFGSRGTPSAILVNDGGRIGSALAIGREQIIDLVASAAVEPVAVEPVAVEPVAVEPVA